MSGLVPEGKPAIMHVTMRAVVDGKDVAIERTYRETVLNKATADRLVDELFRAFEKEIGVKPESAERHGEEPHE